METHYKLLSSVAALIVGSSAFAQQVQPPCPAAQTASAFEQGYAINKDKFPAAYNAPARIEVNKSWDVFLTGSFIYWKADQDSMDLAYPTTTTLQGLNASFKQQKTEYKPGFKLALGYDFDFDNWVGDVEYTWFRSTTSTGWLPAPADARGGTPIWVIGDWVYAVAAQYQALDILSQWKLKIDIVDGTMSRPFYQGRKLTVLPFGGLRAAMIRQNLHLSANIIAATPITSVTQSNSWAIGPRAGMQAHWLVGWGFRMEGDIAGSLLYTKYTKVAHREDDSTAVSVPFYSANFKDYVALRPMADLSLGMGWGSYFDRQNYHFDLLATYDFNVMWGQNMMRNLVNAYNYGATSDAGDLHLQGFTLTARFDF